MSGNAADTERRKVGLFDIRIIIASLIGLYGVILVVTGLFSSQAQAEKAAGLNINILAGIVMVVFAAAFVTWARLRPIIVPPEPKEAGEDGTAGEAGRPGH
jgi:drug/metabolite transporter (DMT)-like permease